MATGKPVGRPKGSTNRKRKNGTPEKKMCNSCLKEKSITNFYKSTSILFLDNLVPICKECIKSKVDYDDMNTIYGILQTIDAPFIKKAWNECEDTKQSRKKEGKNYDLIGNYLRQIQSLKQFKGMGYKDSDFENLITEDENDQDEDKITLEEKRELQTMWGDDWSTEELIMLKKTYTELGADKNLKFNSSKQYLKLATMNYVRSFMAMKNNKVSEAKQYTELFNKTMEMGEFNPSALAKNSNLEKLGSFSDFSLMVEECVDIIDIQKILPQYMEQPRDKADKVIWYMINYMQDSLGYKRSSYNEIYNFYIQMEADYLGISFEEMMEKHPKQSTINDFLDLKEEREEESEV